MTAQRGRDLLIKIGVGASPEVFTTVAGLRATTLAFNSQAVDITNADSADMWRELMAGGVKTATISGSGVFKDAASDAALRAMFFNAGVGNFQVAIPGFGTVTARDDSSCELRTGFESLDALAMYVGMLGVPFEVSEPPELAAHLRTVAARLTRAADAAPVSPADR